MNAVSLPETQHGAAPASVPTSVPISPIPGMSAVTKPDGEVVLMHEDDAHTAASRGDGTHVATDSEYFGAKHGVAGEITSALAGASRAATFGLFDPAFVATVRAVGGDKQAEEYRNTLRLLKQANPNATLAGEVAGSVLPAFFGAPPAEAAGALGEGLLARGAARVAAVAPRAIGEGAAIGLGNQLSEDTLNNHKFASEAYLTSGLKGGTIGLLLAGGGAAALGAAGDRLGQLFGRGELRAEEAVGNRLTRLEEKAAGTEEKGFFAKALETEPDRLRFEGATGAKAVAAEEKIRLGKVLGSEATEAGLPLTGPLVSQAETAKRVATKAEEIGKSFRPIYTEADSAVTRPQLSAIRDAVLDVPKAAEALEALEKKVGEAPSHVELWQAKRMFGETHQAVRDAIDAELTASVERAGTEIGTPLGDRLRLSNSLYADLKTVGDIIGKKAEGSGIEGLSPADVFMGVTHGPAGLAALAVNQVRVRYGSQIAAHVLGTASRMETIQRAATKLDDLIGSGTKSFISGSKASTRAVKPVTTAEVRALRDATRTPEIVNAKVAQQLGDMPEYAPKVAQQISATASRAAAWLQHALPKESAPMGPIFTQPKPRPLSDTDLIRARATIETIEDPSIVLDRLRQGRLTTEHVAALKYVHPETYAQIQKYLGDHATELRPTLTVQQQFSLGMLFGTPISEAQLPENIRAFQASFSQGNQAPGPGGSGGGGSMNSGPVNGGGTRAMGQDRLEAGTK